MGSQKAARSPATQSSWAAGPGTVDKVSRGQKEVLCTWQGQMHVLQVGRDCVAEWPVAECGGLYSAPKAVHIPLLEP